MTTKGSIADSRVPFFFSPDFVLSFAIHLIFLREKSFKEQLDYLNRRSTITMLSKTLVAFFCLLLALALASELKGEKPPLDGDVLPTAVPLPPGDGEKHHPKDPKHPPPPKEPKHHKEKEHKEKDHKKHKDPKDKHPKENEPVAAAAAAYAEPQAEAEGAAEPKVEPAEQEEAQPAPSPIKTKRANHSFPMNRTEAAVEDEAQKAACGTCCGVDMGDVASKLPFINRK